MLFLVKALRNGRRRWSFRFERRDLWIGIYWDRLAPYMLDIYICPLPTLAVRLRLIYPPQFEPTPERTD